MSTITVSVQHDGSFDWPSFNGSLAWLLGFAMFLWLQKMNGFSPKLAKDFLECIKRDWLVLVLVLGGIAANKDTLEYLCGY